MVIQSQYKIEIPQCSLSTQIFGSPHDPLPNDEPYIMDHRKPATLNFTQHTFRLWAQRLACGLQAAGLKSGDRVLLFSPNQMFIPVVFMGVIMAGGIFSGCNPTYSAKELAHQIGDCAPRFVLSLRGPPTRTASAAIDIAFPKNHERPLLFVCDDDVFEEHRQPSHKDGFRYWNGLIASENDGYRFEWDELTGAGEAAERVLALNYSSGTTGLSKGVKITHLNFVANILQYDFLATVGRDGKCGLRPPERYLCYLPLYHAMAQLVFIGIAQLRHVPVYIMEGFDFETMLRNVEKYRITHLHLVPPVAIMLAKRPETKRYDLSSVHTVGCGAAPLSRSASEEVESLWTNRAINVKQGWGMTE